MEGSAAERSALLAQMQTLAARPDVGGVVVDLAQDERIEAVRVQAFANSGCPYATNLWAREVQAVIQSYWALNPALEYVVLVGNDSLIPFFRYPDAALPAWPDEVRRTRLVFIVRELSREVVDQAFACFCPVVPVCAA